MTCINELKKGYETKLVTTRQDKLDFISLPSKLYNNPIQDKLTEWQILNNDHILSSNFDIKSYLVLFNNKVIARAILTIYPNDKTGYVGFFESINDRRAVYYLFNRIKLDASKLNLVSLVGPIDSSFWIRYRFKVDNFNKYYTSEPYNKSYYPSLWESVGFSIDQQYYSNQLRIPTIADVDYKCIKRYRALLKQGYKIRNVDFNNFKSELSSLYDVLTKSYENFPYYKKITRKQFIRLFRNYKYILDKNAVYLVHKDNSLVGFMINVPNYGINPSIISILKLKLNIDHPSEYVSLYLGAEPGVVGIGGGLAEVSKRYYQSIGVSSVSALIRKGNLSGGYYKSLITNKYNYNLYKLDLEDVDS